MTIALVTGGAGFIGSALVRHLIKNLKMRVVNYDAMTYAATFGSVADVESRSGYYFVHGDICNQTLFLKTLKKYKPTWIFHLAAESHVDRSIKSPLAFVQANVMGTATVLTAAIDYYNSLNNTERNEFRFLHISTDEVFGSLGSSGLFNELTAYNPSSPYSATKAASDHLAQAWHRTYGLPVIVTSSSNNYGPFQFPEKLIPLMILRAMHGETLPVYGNGANIRDWLFVEDHACALVCIAQQGKVGATYCISGNAERRNIDVVHMICDTIDRKLNVSSSVSCRALINFVTDRLGHDQRYAIDTSFIEREIGWKPAVNFEKGLERTIDWYFTHETWWKPLLETSKNSSVSELEAKNI